MLKGKKVYIGAKYIPRYLRKKCKYPGKLQKSKYLGIYLVKKGRLNTIVKCKYSSVVGRGGIDFYSDHLALR